MGFFNKAKASETINNMSKDVVDKAKELKEIVSLNSQISSQESLVSKYFKELGQFVYENKGKDITGAVEERILLIDTAKEEIDRLKKELLKKKGLKACPNCGHEIGKDDAFCPKCGYAVPVKEETEETVEEAAAKPQETAEETTAKPQETVEEVVVEETVVVSQPEEDSSEQ